MKCPKFILLLVFLLGGAFAPALGRAPSSLWEAKALLSRDSTSPVEITWNPLTDAPGFIRFNIPLSREKFLSSIEPAEAGKLFLQSYAGGLWGVKDIQDELRLVHLLEDDMGMVHLTYQQYSRGVEVYGGAIKVHLDQKNQAILAASSSFLAGLPFVDVHPQVTKERAIEIARLALPSGELLDNPRLVVFSDPSLALHTAGRLAWLVELRDLSIPARNIYVISASKESILTALNRLTTVRQRKIYDARNSMALPGVLARSEGEAPTGDVDIDNAFNAAGAIYDYFYKTFGRDSYDGRGGELVSTVHFGAYYQNAFWDGKQLVYGDRFPVLDVAAHELSHAITEKTAALEYRWQYGALNESFSDIFAMMVDRNDWMLGEELPPEALAGQEAIRDLSAPLRLGQPAHVRDWVATCDDEEGIHINSGIPNKAFYNIAMTIGRDATERIFFRALTVYLSSHSTLEEARAAAIQAAQDLYPTIPFFKAGVEQGFNSVGLDGEWQPPLNDCPCSASAALARLEAEPGQPSALEAAGVLYQVRDRLMAETPAGHHYRSLYNQYRGRIYSLHLLEPSLAKDGADLIQHMALGLQKLVSGSGDEVIITANMTTSAQVYLEKLAEKDRQEGDGRLANAIEKEMKRISWSMMVGMTFSEAWAYLNRLFIARPLYLPAVFR